MKALLSVLCGFLETRGETICRLTCSLLRYVVIIVALFYALEALGFDPTTLLASLGIFSLALSLGAKDLVADVLSGIMIVFSGEYQIGDIVEIAGFRGRVWEIGVRSTTIVNKDGNMKNISNRNVSNVMNLSSLNSRCHVNLAIPYDQPLDHVREMLNRELPVLSRELGSLADGPAFLGVTGLDAGYVTLSFCAECAEEDMDEVCDKMTCALKSLFEKHDIPFK
jgi:small conductance mechanosensitive channel